MAEPFDYSKTQRIVLLIDLHPLQTFQNPISYLTSVSAAAKRLLTFAPLSQSLFSFKFFFSSLSPLLSASAVGRLAGNASAAPLSFTHPSQTLTSLTDVLTSLSIPGGFEVDPPRASCVASSLHQLIRDYALESEIDNLPGMASVEFPKISSNLVLLLSPVPKSMGCLSEYMNLGGNSEILRDFDGFMVKFRELFCTLSNAFANRDIQFSWIDVRDVPVECVDNVKVDECGRLMLLEKGIKSYGWGFSSTDSIVLGSALIPFGLIYPKIGVSLELLNCTDDALKGRFGHLNLEILDVKGKPLEWKCCDLEFLNLNILPRLRTDNILSTLGLIDSQSEVCNGESVWCIGEGVIRMQIKAIQRYDVGGKIEGCRTGSIVVREISGDSKKCKTKVADDFFAYRVLDILSGEMGEITQRNSMPIWNILLNFLYKEGCQATVSLSSDSGQTSAGILKPLTIHLALLSFIENDNVKEPDWNQSGSTDVGERIYDTLVDANDSNVFSSQTSTSTNCEPLGNGKRKKNKKSLVQNLSWASFCDSAFKCSDFDLAEVCFARKLQTPKTLKFLKCWMEQIKKCSSSWLRAPPHLSQSQQHMLQPLFSQVNLMQEGDASLSCSETAEVFFGNLPKKIEHGLRSGMDLQSFAERLVKSSIRVLSQKYEADDTAGIRTEKIKGDNVHKNLAAELMELLLRKPKEMKEKLASNNPTSEASNFSTTSETIVREYELQVLLRMEILRSDLSESMKDSSKEKLVKQICSLLEIIQYLVEGGIHGHVSLYDYVERTIRTRYCHILEDAVNKIYTRMELLPFGDEDQIQAHLFNSEDSNQSWREKQDRYEMTESYSIQQSIFTADDSNQPLDANESSEGIREEEHARKVTEARERREKALRFVYHSRMRDLQRVWAPRQLKAPKGKSEQQEDSKRKERRKAHYSVVCETPMTERKRVRSRNGDEVHTDSGNSSQSVSKALFQDS
nr:uncharacterized protein LOC109172994 [Ipomoea batatas]